MNKNLLIGIVVVIVLVGVGWFFMKDKLMPATDTSTTVQQQTMESSASPAMDASPMGMMESSGSSAAAGTTKEFTVTGSNFKFDTPEIKVNKGDTVKITFKNSQGFHDFVIDEFNVKAKQAQGPSEETVTFVADKAGTYEYYCSVGQHRAMGMKGSLIVQ